MRRRTHTKQNVFVNQDLKINNMNHFKDWYQNEWLPEWHDIFPPYNQLEEQDRKILEKSFSFTAYRFRAEVRQLKKDLQPLWKPLADVWLFFVLLLLISLLGCTPTDRLPNGCPVKRYNTKPFKV